MVEFPNILAKILQAYSNSLYTRDSKCDDTNVTRDTKDWKLSKTLKFDHSENWGYIMYHQLRIAACLRWSMGRYVIRYQKIPRHVEDVTFAEWPARTSIISIWPWNKISRTNQNWDLEYRHYRADKMFQMLTASIL